MGSTSFVVILHGALAASPNVLALSERAPSALEPGAASTDAAAATGELGAELGESCSVCSSRHFLMVHEGDHESATALVDLLEADQRRFFGLFSAAGFALQEIDHPLVWVLLNNRRELATLSRETEHRDLSWLDAYYSPRTNGVALLRSQAAPTRRALPEPAMSADATPVACLAPAAGVDAVRAVHELAHQLAFNSGLMRRGVTYPLWVAEGMADYFAAVVSECGGRRSSDSMSSPHSSDTTSGPWLPLRQLMRVTELPDDDPAAVSSIYDQAQSLFGFLLSTRRGQLVAFLSAMADADPGPTSGGEIAARFVAAFGDPDGIEQTWTGSVGHCRQ